jgi:3-methyl-2-oxobutanoate hydroxymethyltransferase
MLEDMLRHTEAVARGASRSMIVADLSYKSYNTARQAVANAKRLLKAGAQAVKPEGRPEIVRALCKAKIPVMGHVGLLPQTASKLGVQGRDAGSAENILALAKEIEAAGAFALVIECVPAALAERITKEAKIPTIGIGAGPHCDGQVLVLYDMLGLFGDFTPKFVKRYAQLGPDVRRAVEGYTREVREGKFPAKEHSF